MFRFLRSFATEDHVDERLAEKWHRAHAATYAVLILLYAGSIAWHWSAAGRHRHAAQLLEVARRANSGVAVDVDQGC